MLLLKSKCNLEEEIPLPRTPQPTDIIVSSSSNSSLFRFYYPCSSCVMYVKPEERSWKRNLQRRLLPVPENKEPRPIRDINCEVFAGVYVLLPTKEEEACAWWCPPNPPCVNTDACHCIAGFSSASEDSFTNPLKSRHDINKCGPSWKLSCGICIDCQNLNKSYHQCKGNRSLSQEVLRMSVLTDVLTLDKEDKNVTLIQNNIKMILIWDRVHESNDSVKDP
ncbi:hypothetical protein R6Z07M_006447 [Ovis aries]